MELLDAPIGSAPDRAFNRANKAVTGQQFYRVEQRGDWDAIYFGGQKAWFYNPDGATNTVAGSGTLVMPRPDLGEIPVYGRAYPEAAAYPEDVPTQELIPLYTMPARSMWRSSGCRAAISGHRSTHRPPITCRTG